MAFCTVDSLPLCYDNCHTVESIVGQAHKFNFCQFTKYRMEKHKFNRCHMKFTKFKIQCIEDRKAYSSLITVTAAVTAAAATTAAAAAKSFQFHFRKLVLLGLQFQWTHSELQQNMKLSIIG